MKEYIENPAKALQKALIKSNDNHLHKLVTEGNAAFVKLMKNLTMRGLYVQKNDPIKPKPPLYFKALKDFHIRIESDLNELMKEVKLITEGEKKKNEKSPAYRALKVYIADLNVIIPKCEQSLKFSEEQDKAAKESEDANKGQKINPIKKLLASKEKIEQEKKLNESVNTKLTNTLTGLRQVGTNMEVGVAVGVRFCKETMATPTPLQWNKIGSNVGGRTLSQALTNLVKYIYTAKSEIEESAKITNNVTEMKVISDPRFVKQVEELKIFAKNYEKDIIKLGKPSGKDAFDGSIGFLANDKNAMLPDTATEEDVLRAVKHFSAMLKTTAPIAKALKDSGF